MSWRTRCVTRNQHYAHVIGRMKAGTSLAAARADHRSASRSELEAEYPRGKHRARHGGRAAEDVDGRIGCVGARPHAGRGVDRAADRLRESREPRTLARYGAAAGTGRPGRARRRQGATGSTVVDRVCARVADRRRLGRGARARGDGTHAALNPEVLPRCSWPRWTGASSPSALVLSVVTGVLFGVVPALGAARAGSARCSRRAVARRPSVEAGDRLRRTLVAVQVGLAVILLVGTGLAAAEFRRVDAGPARVRPRSGAHGPRPRVRRAIRQCRRDQFVL